MEYKGKEYWFCSPNCDLNPENTWQGKWSSNAMRKDVVLWTELPQMPV